MSVDLSFFKEVLRETTGISLKLFKVMIPVIVLAKVLQTMGLVEVLSALLAPLMGLVGLPGTMGLVLATTMITNIYGGMAAFVALSALHPLTVAQATIVTSMMLVAHNLLVELRIVQEAGVRLPAMAIIRIAGAFALGWCLNVIYAWGSWLQGANVVSWVPPVQDDSLAGWAIGQLKGLAVIYVAILCLLVLLRIMDRLGITALMVRILRPVLSTLGIGSSAATLTIIGMTLGIAYGGALIIEEAQSGKIAKRDVFSSLTLMGLCHSIFEDTFVVALLGGHLSGILWGRVVFSLICVYFLARWVSRMSETAFERYIFRGDGPSPAVEHGLGFGVCSREKK